MSVAEQTAASLTWLETLKTMFRASLLIVICVVSIKTCIYNYQVGLLVQFLVRAIVMFHTYYMPIVKSLVRLHKFAGSSEPHRLAPVLKMIFHQYVISYTCSQSNSDGSALNRAIRVRLATSI